MNLKIKERSRKLFDEVYIFFSRKPNKRILHIIIFLFLLVIMPHILDAIFMGIAKLGIYPAYCRERFFEEYHKYFFNLIIIIIGFWYANTLIEERIYKDKIFDIERYKHSIEILKKSIIDLKKNTTKETLSDYRKSKSLFISAYQNLLRHFSLINIFKFHFPSLHYKLYEELLAELATLIKFRSSTLPGVDKLDNIINIIEKLQKEF